MIRALGLVGLLTLVYALVLRSAAPVDLAIGAAISGGLLLTLHRASLRATHRPHPGLAARVVAFFPFAWFVAIDVLQGTWNVALIVLGVRPMQPCAFVEVPFGDRTPRGAVVTAMILTLSPGAVPVTIDTDRRVIVFHVLGVDEHTFQRTQREFYERHQRWVFP